MEVLKLKEITMSFQEFFGKDKKLTLDKKDLKALDKIVGKILNNKKLKMAVITSIAYTNMQIETYADALGDLRHAKNEIVIVLQICIGVICIVMCLLEIGKSLIGGRNSDIGSIVMKYALAIIAACTIPRIFIWIGNICGVQL